MLGFLIKKTFFDMWDNFLAFLFMNIGFIILVCGFFILPNLLGLKGITLPIYSAVGVIIISFYNGGVYRYTLDVSDYKKGGVLLFLKYLAGSWKESLVNSIVGLVILAVALYALPYYFSGESIIFPIIGAVLFWALVTVFIASLFFFPSSVRLKKKLLPNIRFCFSFVFDNTAFCFLMVLIMIAALALSVIVFFLFPGIATAILWVNVCFKLRLYKYYYLEAHPGVDRKKIPWDELIAADKELLGKRTMRGLIFPWKQ